MTRKLYCDLDGVLADFDRYIKEECSVKAQTDDAQMWFELSTKRRFYRKLKPMSYAREMWTAIVALTDKYKLGRAILTAIPRRTTMPTAEEDKRQWVVVIHATDVFGDDAPEFFIGPFSKDKKYHCKPGDILIDDRLDNCEDWAAAGGIAIHHQGDWKATIRSLEKELAA